MCSLVLNTKCWLANNIQFVSLLSNLSLLYYLSSYCLVYVRYLLAKTVVNILMFNYCKCNNNLVHITEYWSIYILQTVACVYSQFFLVINFAYSFMLRNIHTYVYYFKEKHTVFVSRLLFKIWTFWVKDEKLFIQLRNSLFSKT